MKRLKHKMALALAGALLLLGSRAFAEGTPGHAAPMAQPEGPALWKVADKDTTIYLFGTVHALPPDTVWMNSRIERALRNAGELVTEVDLNSAKDAKADILRLALLPEGITLRGLLRTDEKASYEKAMTHIGLPVAAFDRFKPWYAAMMLSLLPLAKEGITWQTGVETVLDAKLPPDRKRGALESVNYQLQLFDSLPAETQITYLKDVSDSAPDLKTQLAKMIEQWLLGDADKLAQLLNEENSAPALMERLLYERNRNWAKWVEERLKQPGTVFVAVGAGHLAGAGSVQDELARGGIVSKRVR